MERPRGSSLSPVTGVRDIDVPSTTHRERLRRTVRLLHAAVLALFALAVLVSLVRGETSAYVVGHLALVGGLLVAALTPREVEVLQGVDDGLTRRQVAGRLRIAESTVTDHLKSARTRYLALGRPITNSQSLLREARRDGWISGC